MANCNPTYHDCARDWDLWCEWVNPGGDMSRDEFDALTTAERVEVMIESFGAEHWKCACCGNEYEVEADRSSDLDAICPHCDEED